MVFNFKEFLETRYAKEPHYVVIGNPISHSLSPLMHQAALEYYGLQGKYIAIDLLPDEVTAFIAWCNRGEFRGCNITLPYKQLFLEVVDAVHPSAQSIGAINTIVKEDGKLVGYNTDIYGFLKPLEALRDDLDGQEAVVFGTGGASKAVISGLIEFGTEKVWLVSRRPSQIQNENPKVEVISYDQWTSVMDPVSIVVNSTPIGMYPNNENSPVREGEISFLKDRICYDLIYNPLSTKFLRDSERLSYKGIGGLDMFVHQGSRSFQLWTGKEFPYPKIKSALISHFSGNA